MFLVKIVARITGYLCLAFTILKVINLQNYKSKNFVRI